MNDTNYFGGIVKILETPKEIIFNNKTQSIKFRVQLPQIRKTRIVTLTFWGNLAHDIKNYYKINDYIIIEGYISMFEHYTKNVTLQPQKKIQITVLKAYPFLLNYNQSLKKI
jgi:single-stranded DNA-binding protein